VGLISACPACFSELPGLKYRTVVVILSVFSASVTNQGLAQLISVAVLVGIYPVAIALTVLGLLPRQWRQAPRVFVPVMCVALVLGVVDAIKAAGFDSVVPSVLMQCFTLAGTNKKEGVLVLARCKPQRYRVESRGFATPSGPKRRFFMCQIA
jgi:branched-subunit amino acid permease